MRKIKFDFTKSCCKSNWGKVLHDQIKNVTLQEVNEIIKNNFYSYNLPDAFDADAFCNKVKMNYSGTLPTDVWEEEVDRVISIETEKQTLNTKVVSVNNEGPNAVKVGSVYILTEEEYENLCRCRNILLDLLGTLRQTAEEFTNTYESSK